MPQSKIVLPINLTVEHRRVLLKYFEQTNRLSPQKWKMALAAFDTLGQATLITGRRRMSFQQFYDRVIDRQYADQFIAQLMALADLEAEAETLQQQMAFEIVAHLERDELYHDEVADSEYLAAYCLYWWTSFARGYRFELTVFRELRDAGIDFIAHNLSSRAQRRSPYDLVVGRQLGDIKHTTYFLYTARSLPLKCDFYITRLYDSRRRRYIPVVILAEAAWHDLNGAVTTASLQTAADFFPSPVQIVFEGQSLVIVTFGLWKEKLKQRQQEEIEQ